MTLYTYDGEGVFYLNAGEDLLTSGDEVEFSSGPPEAFEDEFSEVADASETESSGEEDESPSDAQESESDGAESAQDEDEGDDEGEELPDPPIDPTELNVGPLEAELDAGDFSEAELDAIEAAEREGDERVGALNAIEDAQ